MQQRHLYRPFLGIKPVVTFPFFQHRIQLREQTKARGAPADHMEQVLTMPLLNAILVTIKLHSGFKTEGVGLMYWNMEFLKETYYYIKSAFTNSTLSV